MFITEANSDFRIVEPIDVNKDLALSSELVWIYDKEQTSKSECSNNDDSAHLQQCFSDL